MRVLRLQILLSWLIPILIFLVLLCASVHQLKIAAGELSYREDTVFADMGVARNILSAAGYALTPGQPAPPLEDTLWRGGVSAIAGMCRSLRAAPLILGALCAMGTILVAMYGAFRLTRRPLTGLAVGVVAAVSPGVLHAAVSGTSTSMAMLLVTAAAVAQMSLAPARRPLSVTAALLLSLACWIRIEFVLLWPVFLVHGALMSAWAPGEGLAERASVLGRAVQGTVVVALLISPIFTWTALRVGVGWPRLPGVPLSADTWANSPIAALSELLALWRPAVVASFSALQQVPLLESNWPRALVWVGLAVLLVGALKRRELAGTALLPLTLLMLPLLQALVYPYLGNSSYPILLASLEPLCGLVLILGLCEVPFVIAGLAEAIARNRVWSWVQFGWRVSALAVVVFSLLPGLLRNSRVYRSEVASRTEVRNQLSSRILEGDLAAEGYVVDQPGWVGYSFDVALVDLSGRFSPDVLACVGTDGNLDRNLLTEVLADRTAYPAIVWGHEVVLPESYRPEPAGSTASGVPMPSVFRATR